MRVLCVLVVALAGCTQVATIQDVPVQDERNERMEAMMVPGERPVLAQATIHEKPDPGAMDIKEIAGATTWEPRDVPLTYHGVHDAWDEWGRRVPAHIFRYVPMVLIITDVSVSSDSVDLTGEYQPRLVEFAFDQSDGRFLGPTYLEAGSRHFRDPAERHAIVTGYILPLLLFMQLRAMEDVSVPFEAYDHEFRFVETDERHGPGACTAYALEADEMGGRVLTCMPQAHDTPLWAYVSRGDDGITFTLKEGSFRLLPFEGEPMPPREFPRVAWQEVGGNVLASPLAVPPAEHKGDWAWQLHRRAEALFLSPSYLGYARDKDLVLHHAVTGWPGYGPVPLLDQLLGDDPVTPDEHAWMMVTPGEGSWWGDVDTWRGDGPEEEDRHVARRDGHEFDASGYPTPMPDEIGDIVPVGHVVSNYASFAPAAPRHINWFVWPDFGIDLGADAVMWHGMDGCFENEQEAPYTTLSGLTGQLLSAGHVQTRDGGCSTGGALVVDGAVTLGMEQGRPFALVRDPLDPLSLRVY